MPDNDFQLTVPTLQWHQCTPPRLLPGLTLNLPGIPLGLSVRPLTNPVVATSVTQQLVGPYSPLFFSSPSSSVIQPPPSYPPPSLFASEPPSAIGTTLSAVMAMPQTQLMLGQARTGMARKLGVSDNGLTLIMIGLGLAAGGTAIYLYETDRVSSLPAVTIPLGPIKLHGEYPKWFAVSWETTW